MKLRLLSILCCGLLLTGCLELRQTLVFQGPDSCTMSWTYRFPDECSAALLQYERSLAAEPRDPARPPRVMVLDRDSWTAWTKANPDLELLSFSSYVVDGRRKVQAVVACRNALRNLNGGVFGDISLRRNPLGDMQCTIRLPPPPRPDAAPAEEDGAGGTARPPAALAGLLRGTRLVYAVSVPTELLRTNGRKDSFRTCSWEWDFSRTPPRTPASGDLEFSW